MIYVLVTATVEDIEKWKSALAAAAPLRRQFGSTGEIVFRHSGKPNEVIILGEYESLEKAPAQFKSQQFREAAKTAGVTAQPQVTYLKPLLELPS